MSLYFDLIRLKASTNTDLKNQADSPSSKYYLKGIDGLGPPDINVLMKQNTYGDGTYQGSKPLLREIIVRIGLRPDYSSGETVSDLRIALYSRITSFYGKKSYIQLRTQFPDVLIAQVQVYISKFEINPMSKDPEIQITYECMSPFLDAGADVVIPVETAPDSTHPLINNPGSAPVGMQLTGRFLANLSSFRITSRADPSQYIQLNRLYKNASGFFIDTRPGSRRVQYIPPPSEGPNVDDLNVLDDDSTWLMLDPGDNQFDTNTNAAHFSFSLVQFTPRYWGI